MITSEDIKSIRPGFGISPKYYDEVVGKKTNQDISLGSPVKFDLLEP